MNIEDLPALLSKLEDRGKEMEALQTTHFQIAAALRDVVTLLERMEKANGLAMLALAQAMQNLKLGDIHVPPMTVMPAPPAPPQGDADIEFIEKSGRITGARVRRRPAAQS